MDRVDCVVVGAGVVGLAVARALALAGREVVVLEQAAAIGTGTSSRNSEVVHAGIYYPPGSLKARLCVQGKARLYDYCESRGVGYRRCGKWIVATDPAQLPALDRLEQRAAANGVELIRHSGAEAAAIEPGLACLSALLSPSTGIVDSHGLMLALQGDLERAGGVVALQSELMGATARPDGFVLQVAVPGEPILEMHSRELVNAAGLHACALARTLQGLPAKPERLVWPQAHFAKGNYFALSGRAPFSRLVYPAPQDAWLGVHLTLDLGGQARFGPDIEWLSIDHPDQIDYRVDPARAEAFYAEVRRYWPDLPDGALQPAYSGVRPKIHGPDQPAPDFRIDGPSSHGVPGLVQLFGIESPGLTSALALGDHVRDLLI
jgi:L-2-hydroxyglutarate oxidase LhgO